MSIPIRSVRSAFRTEAVVDWMTLEIEVERPTQFQWIQDTLTVHYGDGGRPYVDALDAGAGHSATRFKVRLNDQHCRSLSIIYAALDTLDRKYKLVRPATIDTLEVALDFYSNGARGDKVLNMVARLQTSLAAYGRSHRQVGANRRPVFLDSSDKLDPRVTFYVNNKNDPVAWRVYHKTVDRKQDLPPDQHRARAEFTLRTNELRKHGIYTLEDLGENGFSSFGEYLHFRQFHPVHDLIFGKDKVITYALAHGTRHDRNAIALYPFGRYRYRKDMRTRQPRNAGRPEPLKHSSHTLADKELNHIVRDRLHDLSQRFLKKLEAKQ